MFSYVANLFKPKYTKPDFIWKYMDIDPELVKEIQGIYLAHMPDMSKYKPTQLSDQMFVQLRNLGLPDILGQKVYMSALVYSPAHTTPMWAHKDAIQHDIGFPDRNKYALNLPLINCENSLTTFYSDKNELVVNWPWHGSAQVSTKRIENKKDAIDSYVLDRPIFFNTQVLHAVENFNDSPRYSITIRFEENPLHWI